MFFKFFGSLVGVTALWSLVFIGLLYVLFRF